MNLDELTPAPSANKVNQLAKRVFGYALDLENITESKAQRLHKNLSEQMSIYEKQLGAQAQSRSKYYEMKLALEALTKHIAEKKAKKDYDGDGEIESPEDEYKGSRDKAIKKAMAKESVIKEGAVESSELVMAAKSMVDKYDAMIQDVGEMLNEELQPVADKIRDEMGSDVADQFVAQMTQALQSTMDVMKNDRMVADGATRILTGEEPAAPMGAEPEGDIAADELAMEPTVDMDDEFAAAPAAQGGEEAPVGREKRA